MVTVLHISDLHFGRKSLAEQVDALKEMIARDRFTVVAFSGDLTQRARHWEFARARAMLAQTDDVSRTIAIPGNHDVTWWRAPFHVGPRSWMTAKWRHYLGRTPEPVVRVPGATFVGINSAQGISVHTLTKRMRDLSVIGDLRDHQLARLEREFAQSPASDRRAVVMHHNPVAGELSRRFGFRRNHAVHILNEFARLGVSLVLCGHDHQEAAHFVETINGGTVVSIAGTITTMSRGKRPNAVNSILIEPGRIGVRSLVWNGTVFEAREERRFEL